MPIDCSKTPLAKKPANSSILVMQLLEYLFSNKSFTTRKCFFFVGYYPSYRFVKVCFYDHRRILARREQIVYRLDCRSTAQRHLLPKNPGNSNILMMQLLEYLFSNQSFPTQFFFRGLLPERPFREHGRVSDNKRQSGFQLLVRYLSLYKIRKKFEIWDALLTPCKSYVATSECP